MLENGKISSLQLIILVTLLSIGTTILIVPSSMAGEARQDAWIASILGLGIGGLFVLLQVTLANMYPITDLFQMTDFGDWSRFLRE